MNPYLGEIRAFAGDYAPKNWALCDGSLISSQKYQALYSLLGTTYGGNGSTTFGLPDLRGKVMVSNGHLEGGSDYPLAGKGGEEMVTLTTGTLPVHTHRCLVSNQQATLNQPLGSCLAVLHDNGNPNEQVLAYLGYDREDVEQKKIALHPETLSASGNAQPSAHENRQPYVCISYIISLTGLYPSFKEEDPTGND